MYTNKDIRCFIMTRNRPDFLVQSLNSLLSQKGGPWDIWILDNSTDDKTENLIKTKYPDIHYERTYGGGIFVANMEKMQSLMDTAYTLTLHDDDLLAPNYLQNVLKALNYYDNLAGVFSRYFIFKNDDIPAKAYSANTDTKHWLIQNQAYFALSFWHKPSASWTGCVLKSDLYRKLDFKKDLNAYGKIFDWPILINTVENNKVLIFKDNYIYYRVHSSQHTNDNNSGITAKQLANWIRYYKELALTKKELKNIYILRAYERALSNYNFFLQKNEQKNCKDLFAWFEKENLNIPPMGLYHKILKNKALTPIKHLFKRFYKRDYFKQFITDFK